jgi:hypothetical protein
VETRSGDVAPDLTVLESVRCLDCGWIYAKPSGGGTVRQNPGCPECGYVGWIALDAPVTEHWRPSRSAAGLRPRPIGRRG